MTPAKTPSLNHIFVDPAGFEKMLSEADNLSAREDVGLSEEEKIDQFDQFYDLVTSALQKIGSFSDGGLDDADFSSSRYVDPSRCLTITSNVKITKEFINAVLACQVQLGRVTYVHFDSIDGQWMICSDGRFFEQRENGGTAPK